jgi:hypothetical protein
MGGNGGFGFAGERAASIYGGENSSDVTAFIPPRFRRPPRTPASPTVALQGRGVLQFYGNEGSSLETAEPRVPPGPDPMVL